MPPLTTGMRVLLSALTVAFVMAQTFTATSYTGAVQRYTVPPRVTEVFVELWGAGGGASTPPTSGVPIAAGGAGAYVSGFLSGS